MKTNFMPSAKRALLVVFMLAAGAGRAADSGMVSFQSAGSLLRGGPAEPYALSANSVTLSGELLFPEGAGPFPAVVLAHGCAGNRNVESAWGPFLRGLGYATFNTDSFGGRCIS